MLQVDGSVLANTGGRSSTVSISGTSAQSPAINDGFCTMYSTVDFFYRVDVNPTALSTGVDDFIPGGNKVRLVNIPIGHKIAFKTTGAAGTVYITPGN